MDPGHYLALRTGAGLADRADRGLIAVRGADRAGFLQGLLTNDVEALAEGESCYAAWLSPQGRMVFDLDVLHAGDALLLDVDRGSCARLIERLDALVFAEDVRLEDLSGTWTSHGLHGPDVLRLLQAVATPEPGGAPPAGATVPLRALPPNRGCGVTVAGVPARVARTDALGIPGVHLFTERAGAAAVRAAVAAAGAVAVGAEALETVRVESGRPRFGADLDADTIPLEAGIEDRAISFDKGCYVGQEVIVRILHRGRGRVARKLVGLTLAPEPAAADAAPPPGTALRHGDAAVGRVTSAARSPALERVVALGYVPRALSEPGIEFALGDGDAVRTARVTRLPFVAPPAA